MRRIPAAAVVILVCALGAPAASRRVETLDVAVQTPVYELPANLPLPDEELHYALRWAGLPVGGVSLAMAPAGPEGLGVAVRGATHPGISWLYRLRFSGEALVATAPFGPRHFTLDSCEGDRQRRTEIHFPESEGEPVRGIREKPGRSKEYVFHSTNSFDIPSAAYLLMSLDYEPGEEFVLDAFTGKDRYLVKARVEGLEPMEGAAYTGPAWHLRLETRELTDEDPERKHRGTHVWLSPERPRRIVRASSETFVGSLTLELEPAAAEIAAAAGDARCS